MVNDIPIGEHAIEAEENLSGLLLRAKAGDQRALGALFERLSPFLLQIANEELDPKLRQKAGGSDLVQLTLMEAGQALPSFEGSSKAFIAWVRQILLNNIANQRRYYRSQKRSLNREVRLDDDGSTGLRIDHLAKASDSKSNALCNRETLGVVYAALASLPEDYQHVIAYRNQQKLSFQEIGQIMNRSDEAARKLWGRAIEALKLEIDRRQR